MKPILVMILLTAALPILAQIPSPIAQKTQSEQETLKTEQELRDAYLKRDIKTTEKLVAARAESDNLKRSLFCESGRTGYF